VKAILDRSYNPTLNGPDNASEALLSQLPFDLIAMEEVDRYHGFFASILRLFDSQGLFCPKPSSPGVKMGWYSDGCCMFWKQSVFTLVSEYRGQYPESNQVYLLAALRHKQTAQDIVVAVTHLKAQQNQANELIRCQQADAFREQIDQMVARVQNNNSQRRNDPSSSTPDIIFPSSFWVTSTRTHLPRVPWTHHRHGDIAQLSLVLSH
jgi:mRNA deadenylase 3'-5' endonuclease subunit Ccr4